MAETKLNNSTLLTKVKKSQLLLPILALLLMLVINVIITPDFFNVSINNGVLYGYIIDVLNRSCELIILAIGMTLVVASSRGTDISVGAIMAVSGAIIVRFLGESYDGYATPMFLAILFGIIGGIACGAFNGLLVARFNIQPMIATLILYTAGRGIAQLISSKLTETGAKATGVILYVRMESFRWIGGFLPHVVVPTPIFIVIAFIILTQLMLKKTAISRLSESIRRPVVWLELTP